MGTHHTPSGTRPAALDSEPGTPPAPRGSDWRRAWRALQELLDDGDDTAKAFEVTHALDGDYGERVFQRFLAQPGARDLLQERPSLLDALARDRLAALPDESFGRLALAHLDRNGLDPRALVRLHLESIAQDPELDPARAWFRMRFVLMHDLWHVLSGYGSDGLGETALLWFSTAQTGARSGWLLSLGAGADSWRHVGRSWPAYVARARRRGRSANGLLSLPYEKMLVEPLAAVRSATGIAPPAIAHPGGVLRMTEAGDVERISPDLELLAA